MSKDLRNTSLSAQAAQLKRTLENRDKRRQADKIARHAGQDDENDAVQQQPTRASVPNQSVAALTALSGQQSQQPVLRCELCQASFLTDVSHQQHLQSAVHRKALEKQQAEIARQQRLQQSGLQDVTAMALGAAAWGATHDAGAARGPGSSAAAARPGPHPAHGRNRFPRDQARSQAANRSSKDIMTHEQMTQAMRTDDEDLHIDGWVPPTINVPPASHPATTTTTGSTAQLPQQGRASNMHQSDQVAQKTDALQANLKTIAAASEVQGSVKASNGKQQQAAAGLETQGKVSATEAEGNVLGLGYGGADSDSDDNTSSSAPSAASGEHGEAEGRSFF